MAPNGKRGGGSRSRTQPDQPAAVQDVHRFTFVQHLMRVGVTSELEARNVVKALTGSGSAELLDDIVGQVNESMGALHLRIRKLKYPLDDGVWLGLVNTHEDAPSKMGSRYSHQQLEFFKLVVEAIACEDRGAPNGMTHVSHIALLNMVAAPAASQAAATQGAAAGGRLSKTDKEAALRMFVADGWLAEAPERPGYLCIGVRTFLELGDLLAAMDLPDATRQAWDEALH